MRSFARAVIGAAAVSLLQSCMVLPTPITRNNPDTPDATDYEGIEKILNRENHLRLLVVHGMSPQKVGFSDSLQAHLEKVMQLTKGACAVIDTFTSTYDAKDFPSHSYVRRCAYTRGAQTVDVYEVTWSELSQSFANRDLSYDWTKHQSERVFFNAALKQGLMDQAFSDAITYVGTFGPTIRLAVKHAICVLMTDGVSTPNGDPVGCTFGLKTAETAPTFGVILLSHSLGSLIVFETLRDMLADKTSDQPFKVTAQDFVKRVRLVGLLANQLPLLWLSRTPENKADVNARDRGMKIFAESNVAFPIVAVSDPNDLLSYPLENGWTDRLGAKDARIINVTMANDSRVVIGGVNPLAAHTGYYDNACVVTLLVSGEPTCPRPWIAGFHFTNPGRVQADAGVLFRPRSAVSVPVYVSVGPSSVGFSPALAYRTSDVVLQLRPSVSRTFGTLTNEIGEQTLSGIGFRASWWTFTAGADLLANMNSRATTTRFSFGTGW